MDLFDWRPDLVPPAGPRPSPMEDMLNSFERHTTVEEKSLSEFLIKFDSCDPYIPSDDFFENYNFNIKKYVWDRNGGRTSLHEAQTVLYKFIREDCKMVQIFADDFVFVRDRFVSDILNFRDTYSIISDSSVHDWPPTEEWGPSVGGAGGYAPCFSTRIIDAISGTFGPHCNSDGFAEELRKHLILEGDFDPFVDIAGYYRRVMRPSTQDKDDPHDKLSQDVGGRGGSFARMAKNVMARKLQEELALFLLDIKDYKINGPGGSEIRIEKHAGESRGDGTIWHP